MTKYVTAAKQNGNAVRFGGVIMRKYAFALLCIALFFCLLPASVFADAPDGYVVYRQRFADVSTPSAAGVVKGERGADGFSLSVEDEALSIDSFSDERAYVLLPVYNCMKDYTVRFTFSVSDIRSEVAYFGFMLTCKGTAPDNVTAVRLRAGGECDGFSDGLGDIIKGMMRQGERLTVEICVKDGFIDGMSVTCGDRSRSLIADRLTAVSAGGMGVYLRNCSARLYEVSLIKGTEYGAESGEYADSSSWTDEFPCVVAAPLLCEAVSESEEHVNSPITSDSVALPAIVCALSLTCAVRALRRRRTTAE